VSGTTFFALPAVAMGLLEMRQLDVYLEAQQKAPRARYPWGRSAL
jgi:hypothetical protein